ncbi:four helix bundle protein [Candidatus Falkowbacteria bacterium]|nr:four helix bundle protein [Candidatus Falkowbacteria bacterium]
MQNAQETQLFQSVYKLMLCWHESVRLMPKSDKFSIGQTTTNLFLEVLTDVATAYHLTAREQKTRALQSASVRLEKLKIMIRVAKDVKVIKEPKYIEYQAKLQESGKMLGGWIARLLKNEQVK